MNFIWINTSSLYLHQDIYLCVFMWYLTAILPDNNFTWKKLYCDYVFYCDAETEASIPICENQQPQTSKAFSSNIAKRNFFKKTNVISKILDFKGIGKKSEVAVFQKRSLKMIG